MAHTLICAYAPIEACGRARGRRHKGEGGTGTLACALCMGCINLGHRQECLCHTMGNVGATAQASIRRSPFGSGTGSPNSRAVSIQN